MDDALARHLVDERDRLLQRRLRAGQIVAVDGGADALERAAQARTELAVVLAVLQTLTMRLERGCMRSHVIGNLRKPPNLNIATHGHCRRALQPDLRRPTAGTFTAVDDLSFEVGARRDRRADRPERRRQDDHAAIARRHPAADRRAACASTATTSSPTPLEAKRRLAFMPDEPHLFEYLTVDEHLRLVGAALRRRRFRAPGARRSSTSSS